MTLTSYGIVLLAKLFSGFTVRWIDSTPDTCQRIYFANHTSHLDAVVLWSALPRAIRQLTRPVAAKDYWDSSAFRRHMAKSFNAMLVDRKEIKVHRSPVQIILEQMGDRHSIILFPEGGRSKADDAMGPFKSGLYHLAKKRPELELVPVYIDNVNRILPRGEVLPVPLLSCITIGGPIFLEKDEPKAAFLSRARQTVADLKHR